MITLIVKTNKKSHICGLDLPLDFFFFFHHFARGCQGRHPGSGSLGARPYWKGRSQQVEGGRESLPRESPAPQLLREALTDPSSTNPSPPVPTPAASTLSQLSDSGQTLSEDSGVDAGEAEASAPGRGRQTAPTRSRSGKETPRNEKPAEGTTKPVSETGDVQSAGGGKSGWG